MVLIRGTDAEKIKKLLDNETRVFVEIEEGQKVVETVKVQRSSVLFVSVSFIVLMIISLAWLVFYYIQRFRYAQARDRTQVSCLFTPFHLLLEDRSVALYDVQCMACKTTSTQTNATVQQLTKTPLPVLEMKTIFGLLL